MALKESIPFPETPTADEYKRRRQAAMASRNAAAPPAPSIPPQPMQIRDVTITPIDPDTLQDAQTPSAPSDGDSGDNMPSDVESQDAPSSFASMVSDSSIAAALSKGYDDLTAIEIVEQSRKWSAAERALLLPYEEAYKGRKTVIAALSN